MSTRNAADFEEAIEATNFGAYNVMLMLVAFPSTLSTYMASSGISFILPAAQCDLDLTLQQQGALNAMVYAGMLTSGFLPGFLTDVIGRRKIIIYTFWIDALLAICVAFTSNTYIMLFAKFIVGFIINGAAAAVPTYLSEYHGKTYRPKVPLFLGFTYNMGNILLPLLSWAILPMDFHYVIFSNYKIHAWNLFLAICCLPSIIAGLCYYLMPKSPKFLMTQGQNDKALEIFQKVYNINTRKPKETYPIKNLIVEQEIISSKKSLKAIWQQIVPLFSRKFIYNLILMCFVMFFTMINLNGLRLWIPQIFQTVGDYETNNNVTTSFCTMLESINENPDNNLKKCNVNLKNSSVYIHAAIVATSTMIFYLVVGPMIHIFEKKVLLGVITFIAALFTVSIYFAPNMLIAIIFICINLGCANVGLDIAIAIVIDLFPTTLRASALCISLLSGRLGSLIGNLAIPYLLQIGCGPLFFFFAAILLTCSILTLFIPRTYLKSLE